MKRRSSATSAVVASARSPGRAPRRHRAERPPAGGAGEVVSRPLSGRCRRPYPAGALDRRAAPRAGLARRGGLAALLRGAGHRVTSIAPLYKRLFTRGVVLTPGTELRAVEGSAVVVANGYSGSERRIEGVDTS